MSKPLKDKNIQVPDSLLKDLLTPSEARMLKNRYLIIQLLFEGLSIRKIANEVKVGTDTVVRIARLMERKNLVMRIKKQTSPKTTSWIFGKGNG